MRPAITSFATIAACLLYCLIGCQPIKADDLETRIDELLKPFVEKDLFSGTILIAEGSVVRLAKGYGLANREWGIPCAPDTKYRIGSITKQFTSMLVMQLEQEGKLSTSDTLSKFIPDYPRGDEITIHHLLTHTSGVPSYTSLADFLETMMVPVSLEELIERFKRRPLEFEPGERYNYSNSGYILLTYIIEQASGEEYEKLLHEKILDPLGMSDTGYDHYSEIIERRADGYTVTEDGVVNARYLDMSLPSGAGALYTTALDLVKWDRALYGEDLLPADARERMFTPFRENYAYGWGVRENNGRKAISHGGGINGFLSVINRYVDDDALIVVLCNIESPYVGKLMRAIPAVYFGDEYEKPVLREAIELDEEILKEYAGSYVTRTGMVFNFSVGEGNLVLRAGEEPPVTVQAETETEFFILRSGAQFRFERDESGRVSQVVLIEFGKETVAMRIEN